MLLKCWGLIFPRMEPEKQKAGYYWGLYKGIYMTLERIFLETSCDVILFIHLHVIPFEQDTHQVIDIWMDSRISAELRDIPSAPDGEA